MLVNIQLGRKIIKKAFAPVDKLYGPCLIRSGGFELCTRLCFVFVNNN